MCRVKNKSHRGIIMKKVIFDIDGVLLSEERYFDVSGLVVWEWLYGKKYMGLPSEQDDFDGFCVNEGQIAAIRNKRLSIKMA